MMDFEGQFDLKQATPCHELRNLATPAVASTTAGDVISGPHAVSPGGPATCATTRPCRAAVGMPSLGTLCQR